MHQARRPIRIRRSGIRIASTAAKPAPRSLGKWERPQPTSSATNPSDWPRTSDTPQDRAWTPRLSQGSPSSTSRASGPRKWNIPQERSVMPSPSANGSSNRTKWSIPRPSNPSTQPPRFNPPGIQREPAPHQARSSPGSVHSPPSSSEYRASKTRSQSGVRDAAPHQAGPPSSRSGATPLAQILRKDRINAEWSNRAQHADQQEPQEPEVREVEEEAKDVEESAPTVVEEVELEPQADGGATVRSRMRAGADKQGRRVYKERGSIVSRLRTSEDVAIPKHARGPRVNAYSSQGKEKKKAVHKAKPVVNRDIFIPSVVSVRNLAKLLNVRLDTLRRTMIKVGMDAEASYDHMLTSEYASLLAMEFHRNPVVNDEAAFDIFPPPAHANPSTLPSRPPVVTIMGHVDHGKTTLLDTLRSSSVAKGEAGGITQHIGAFSVPVSGSTSNDTRTITFLDTPGHAAFSAMRARGAGVTDIVVLVVAADDGIMPQTREVIELIQKDKVGVVVAINKVDKPGVDISKVEHALLAAGIQLETFGGDVPSVPVSGLTGQGLDQLVETISALAEMQDLRAEREGNIQGYVLESQFRKGLGPVATVLLLRGCLKPSDHIIAGMSHGKVRVLSDSNGQAVKAAYPGMAVTVSGWKELPTAGDEVLKGTESEVKKALANRIRKAEMDSTLEDMEAINEQRRLERVQKEKESDAETTGDEQSEDSATANKESGLKELRLVVKADVSGSVEAVAGALQGIGNHIAGVKIVATGVGDVNESDVMRAKAVGGTVVAFSVNIPRPIQAVAASQQVSILSSTIIYRLMDEVKQHVIALLPVIVEKRVSGEANVLQLFDIHLKGRKTMKVAGCRVSNGLVEKSKPARVVRDGEVIHEGRLETFKHLKKDIMEASKGIECGMAFESFEDLREGDMIQTYQIVEKPGSL